VGEVEIPPERIEIAGVLSPPNRDDARIPSQSLQQQGDHGLRRKGARDRVGRESQLPAASRSFMAKAASSATSISWPPTCSSAVGRNAPAAPDTLGRMPRASARRFPAETAMEYSMA